MTLGFAAGLRVFVPLAGMAWAAVKTPSARRPSPVTLLGHPYAPLVLTILAAIELVSDKLPPMASRLVPLHFGVRLLAGAVSGAVLGAGIGGEKDPMILGAMAGVFGTIAGTFSGAWLRGMLTRGFGHDLPAALCEDVLAIALVIGCMLSV